MKLTEQEIKELRSLRTLTRNMNIPMTSKDQDRLKYLNAKEFHNCCSNPHCTGHEGSENENICPKCKSKLFKLI